MHIFSKRLLRSAAAALTASVTMICTAAPMLPVNVSAADTCVIDTASEYQTIQGFGGINHPEWIGDLTSAQVKKAFGNGEDELGLTILRVYVNDDSSQWSKSVNVAKQAQALGATVFATPWNPPASMRIDGDGTLTGGKYQLDDSKYAEYAAHLNNYVKYVESQGVDLHSISVQNEPDFAEGWTYWSTDELTSFVAEYGDDVVAGTNAKLMSPESFQYRKDIYNSILNNSAAYNNTDLFGTHFYGTQRSQMDFPALENSGKEIWMTEVYVPNSSSDADTWPEALDVAENIHNGLAVGNMSAYVWWYIRRSYGPMKENGNISKRGYMMAQYSKFVRPGDVRISATEQPADNVYISAYKGDDNQLTIVAVNKGTEGYSQNFTINSGETITNVDRYRSSGTENLAATLNMDASENSFWAQLPAQSVSTFVVSLEVKANSDGTYFHDTFEGDTFSWNGRGAADVTLSGRTAYAGAESLLVQNRTAAWNGAYKSLSTGTFVPGNEYSFSADVMYFDGDATDTFYMKLQYTDADGETQYSPIAEATAVKGQWVQLANTSYTIPAGAKDLQLYIETADSTNNFYIDEAIGAVAGTVIEGPAEVKFTLGDINSDGRINIFDVCLAKNGLSSGFADSTAALAADVNENGSPDADDAKQLQKYVAGTIDSFTAAQSGAIDTPAISMAEYTAQINANLSETEPAIEREEKDGVKYGTVQKVSYYSNTCKRNRNFNILLPDGYSDDKKYPVMYAMHGYWQNEDTLIDENDESMRLRQIIGNAIAAGEAEDMIVVFPYIYASATQDACSAMDDANNAAYDNFINELTNDLMPYIEANYSVKTGKDNTALTGFSMGGRESLYISNKRPDLFGYVGAICPAPGVSPGLIAEGDFKFTSESPYLLLLTAGSDDTVVYSSPEGYHNILTNNSVPHVWHYVNGGYHGGNCIRAHMYNFVRAAFKAE